MSEVPMPHIGSNRLAGLGVGGDELPGEVGQHLGGVGVGYLEESASALVPGGGLAGEPDTVPHHVPGTASAAGTAVENRR
jgi:hypothetical protein